MDPIKTGRLIAAARRKKNLTQLQLAEQLHVTDRAVSKWERGRSFPDVGQLEPLCEALGLSLNELIRGEEAKEGDEAATPHELLSLTGELLRRKELRLRLLSAILAVILLLLAGTAVYRAWNDPSRPAVKNTLVWEKNNSEEEHVASLLRGGVYKYRYTLRQDVQAVRWVVQVWTPEGLYSERCFRKDDVLEDRIPYRGELHFIIEKLLGQEQPEVTFGLDWKDNYRDLGRTVSLPEGEYCCWALCPYQGAGKAPGDALPLASFTALKRDPGTQGFSQEELVHLRDDLSTLQPGQQPFLPEDGVSLICWLELIPEQ